MITAPILVDAGPLVALILESDSQHARCTSQLRELQAPLLTCWTVLAEAAYLLRRRPELVESLLALTQSGGLAIPAFDATDVPGVTAILNRYRDQGFQLADACLTYLADRDGIEQVFTLDQRDF